MYDKIPKLHTHNVRIIAFNELWTACPSPQMIAAMEQWGKENLKAREAAVGSHTHLSPMRPSTTDTPSTLGTPSMLQFWIARHDDVLDPNPRPNLEVVIRQYFRDEWHVWHSQRDQLTYGVETDFAVRAVYDRVANGGVSDWETAYLTVPGRVNQRPMCPAVNSAALFSQCSAMAGELQKFLRDRGPKLANGPIFDPEEEAWWLHRLFSTSMLYQAASRMPSRKFHPVADDEALVESMDEQLIDTRQFGHNLEMDGDQWVKSQLHRLKRKPKAATAEQVKLFYFLQQELEWLDSERKERVSYNVLALRKLNTKWVNRIAQRLGAFV